MRLVWNQRQILVKIFNILHINFQRQIVKGQLSINLGKSRSLAHNNFPVVLFFILKSILVLFLGFIFVCLPLFACLIFLGTLSSCPNLTPFVWYCFFSIKLFLALILWPLNLVLELILNWCLFEWKFDLSEV